MRDWRGSPGFALFDLSCAGLAAAWWYAQPAIGWWPLLIGLLPWAVRITVRQAPFRRTPLDIPVTIFGLSAFGSLWVAYNREAAAAKLSVLVGAIVLFYALAGQPRANFGILAGVTALCGATIATVFILGHDWQREPADFAGLTRLGEWVMQWRPVVNLRTLPPNFAGGQLAALTPVAVAALGRSPRRLARVWRVVAPLLVGLLAAGMLLTSSRGAWLALALAAGLYLLQHFCRWAARRTGLRHGTLFGLVLLALVAVCLGVTVARPEALPVLADEVPGRQSGSSRLNLTANALRLIADFPFTGGGLASFGGLYSRYILVIPVFMFSYSHNLYLDVAVEQGVLGAVAMVGMVLGSLTLIAAQLRLGNDGQATPWMRWPIIAGLLVVCLHGLVDDALYGVQATPFLFALPGMAVAASSSSALARPAASARGGSAQWKLAAALLTVACLAPFGRRLQACWFADLGSVAMARVELDKWRDDAINDIGLLDIAAADGWFRQALVLDPTNLTAHYRLGLMAMQRNDFTSAASHLQTALTLDPQHPGVLKATGYDYVWLGRIDLALPLLAQIPEARTEMDYYAWWWSTQGQPDLAARASQLANQLP